MLKTLLFITTILSAAATATACSMCKITANGKTVVGNNEDTWRTGAKLWFEQGSPGKFGAAYFGLANGFPQGGLNEAGLAFDGLTVYPRPLHPQPGKQPITSPAEFLKNILRHCSTVRQVKDTVTRYNRSLFNTGMFLFVDKTGEYLVIEVDTVILGNDPTYLLVNFCPSQTKPADVKIGRYHGAGAFLQRHQPQATIPYCTQVMDTMHECRAKIGDGTTYTSVYDLDEGLITLYFYHNYSEKVVFRLKEELAKPDHNWEVSELFSDNKEYRALLSYLTPLNSPPVRRVMAGARIFFVVTALIYIFLFIRSMLSGARTYLYPILAITNILCTYLFTLLMTYQNEPIFYFSFPYSFEENKLKDAMVYFPLALLAGYIPLIYGTARLAKTARAGKFVITAIGLNLLAYLALLIAAGYWGLLGII